MAAGAVAVATVENTAVSHREQRHMARDTAVGEGLGRAEAIALGHTNDMPQPRRPRGMLQL
jgi:hypothetical protein